MAVIIEDGIRRIRRAGKRLHSGDEAVRDAAMPKAREGILEGLYRFRATSTPKAKLRRSDYGSGAICQKWSRRSRAGPDFGVSADVWSITSYVQLYPTGSPPTAGTCCTRRDARVPYVTQCVKDAPGVFVAASDYVKALPHAIDRWLPRRWKRSAPTASAAVRAASLRDIFEVDARCIVIATLGALARDGQLDVAVVKAITARHRPDKLNPAVSCADLTLPELGENISR
jgi:pyruvate dehydrogenase E1 component